MGKPFSEVFPSLSLEKNVSDIMNQTEVEKVSSTKKKDYLRIYIKSNRLIGKEDIYSVESTIKNQLFPGAALTVKIYERFELSSQYTPENLLELYYESMLYEIQEYSNILYNMLKSAVFSFPATNQMVVSLEDSVIARSKEEELTDILQKIMVERCGFNLEIYTEYHEGKSGKYAEEDQVKLKQEVSQIYDRAMRSKEKENTDMPVDKAATEQKEQNAEKKDIPVKEKKETPKAPSQNTGKSNKYEFKKGEFKKGEFKRGGDFGKSAIRSDDPDVLYGRNIEDEVITKIEELVGEIGEVVVRGKILDFERKEIKNEKSILMFNVTDFTDTITVKMFARNDQVDEITKGVKPGAFVKIKGITIVDKFDHELTIQSISGIKKIPDFTTSRVDTAARKRVELHCHTKMSDMDGVSEAKDIVKRAYKWGHKGSEPGISLRQEIIFGFFSSYCESRPRSFIQTRSSLSL